MMNPRTRELATIHCLARDLGLERDVYKCMLRATLGVDSAGDLDARGRRRLIAQLRAKLGKPARIQHPDAPHNLDTQPQLRKIEALLADAGRPWSYAEALARRICRRQRLEFCGSEDLRKIIAALTYDQGRRERRAGGVANDG